MTDLRCICGHSESMHFHASGRCMKIIARDARSSDHLRCTCRTFICEPNARSVSPAGDQTQNQGEG